MDVQPFGSWKWYCIALLLLVEVVVRALKKLWFVYGLDKVIYTAVEVKRYNIIYRKSIEKFKKDVLLKNKSNQDAERKQHTDAK